MLIQIMRQDVPFVIGHRGAAAEAPENTLVSIRRAAADGARWVEFDVKLSKDGVPFLFHDDTLGRTTNGKGKPEDLTMAELQTLDAGGWFGPAFKGERVPTLGETAALLIELGLGANVEIKPAPGQARETALAVAAALAAEWTVDLAPPVVSTFNEESMAAFAAAAPNADRAMLFGRLPVDWKARAKQYGCSALHISDRAATRENVADILNAGYAVRVYTINDRNRMDALKSMGVGSVFTDKPALYPS